MAQLSSRSRAARARPCWPVVVIVVVVIVSLVGALVVWVARRELGPLEAGSRLLDAGNPRAAILPLLRAVTLRPDDAVAHCRLGLAYARIGWHTAALQQFEMARALSSSSHGPLMSDQQADGGSDERCETTQ